ncbi:MAG TPA: quinol:electron acceptor oxidoreductase subunit ActD [Anaerolineales bacterium]|nr:quinol:electron acceptor oxidoreductase subunit ActD [Anaerolineales bacterium]
MKKMIGGLFETQENANLAYEALEKSGFASDAINMFVHKPKSKTARSMEVRVQDIAKNAIVGGLIGGAIGGFLGFLVGIGILPLPYLEPGSAPREPLFIFMSIMWGLITGGLTGIILGVASRLLRSREKAEVMTRQIEKRGVLITVDVSDSQRETRARRVMEEHNAIEVGNPQEKWDPDVWVSPNEKNPSLANTR